MKKEEAIEAMKNGKKVTHFNFLDKQYLFMLEGDTFTEKYYNVGKLSDEFWKEHSHFGWEKGWEIFEEVPEKIIFEENPAERFLKKQVILEFIKNNLELSITNTWKCFKTTNSGLCSQVYFYHIYHIYQKQNQ